MYLRGLRFQRTGKGKKESKQKGGSGLLPVLFEWTPFQNLQFPGLRHLPVPEGMGEGP
jgi:hypothetical protein